MAKRHLNEQQRRNIEQRNAREVDNADLRPGLVVAHHGKQVMLEDSESGERHGCTVKQTLGAVATGDRVRWRENADGRGSVEFVEARRSLLIRPDTLGKPRLMAANIDQVLITIAPVPEPNASVIDRAIVAALDLPAEPLLLINKVDRLNAGQRQLMREFVAEWRAAGVDILEVSALSAEGIDLLKARLHGHQSLFVGLSGVGKSSLVSALMPAGMDILVGEISEHSQEGRHTTRTSTLYHLPSGGDVVDAPGVRDFGVWNITREAVRRGFAEIEHAAQDCRFSNCTHRAEPACAVKQAVAQRTITPRRYQSFLEMMDKAAEQSQLV